MPDPSMWNRPQRRPKKTAAEDRPICLRGRLFRGAVANYFDGTAVAVMAPLLGVRASAFCGPGVV